jgi:hypothetical protein
VYAFVAMVSARQGHVSGSLVHSSEEPPLEDTAG